MPNLYKFELPSSSKLMIALRNGLKPNLAVQYLLRTQKEYLPNFTPNAISQDFVSIAFNLNKNKRTVSKLMNSQEHKNRNTVMI